MRHDWLAMALAALVGLAVPAPAPAQELTRDQAADALERAVRFFREQVAAEAGGGYLYRYSADLSRQEGETLAKRTTAWIQPPGTPAVGEAYLTVHARTGDAYYLEAARETAMALVRGQLESGGWDNQIEFDPKDRADYAYRVESQKGRRNTSTLDDNKTQSAIRLLMRVDRALEFRDETIHEATLYALESLLTAQYPNGAWPQRYSGPADKDLPVRKADYPPSWPRTFPSQKYDHFYTFNDNTVADVISVLFEAAAIYDEPRYAASASKGGDFILLAQMPDPQPAWAQQYSIEMHPMWARKFEPPAISGGESQGLLRTLVALYHQTGDEKYLEPVPRALEYLKASRLPDGRLARFYELKTNRPLYFTKEYELTYSSASMPTHYGFIVSSSLDRIERDYKQAREGGAKKPDAGPRKESFRMSGELAKRAKEVVAALDERGAWVEPGALRNEPEREAPGGGVIDTRTFTSRVLVLSEFLAAKP